MLPNLNKIIDRFASAFRIEQRIISTDDELTLVTESFLGTRLLYTHHLDMLPLLEEMRIRIQDSA
jgi:hypothetical protein